MSDIDVLKTLYESSDVAVELDDVVKAIASLVVYRDRCPRGSARRADFASSIRRLKAWQQRLERQLSREDDVSKGDKRAKRKLHEGIVHFDQAKVDTIMPIIRKLIDASGDLEVTEKCDGVALIAGVVDGRFYTSTKRGQNIFDVDAPTAYDVEFLKPFADVHKQLSGSSLVKIVTKFKQDNVDELRNVVPSFDVRTSDVEFFFEYIASRANVIAYDPQRVGDGVLIVLDVKVDDRSLMDHQLGDRLINSLKKQLKTALRVDVRKYHDVSRARGALSVDVIKSFEEIERELASSRNVVTKDLKGRAQAVIDAVRSELIDNWVDLQHDNMLGNTEIEGLVIKDKTTGELIKLVNREKFTQRLKLLWQFRRESGNTTEKLRRDIAHVISGGDRLLVDLVAATAAPNFKKKYGEITQSELDKRVRSSFSIEHLGQIEQLLDVYGEEIDALWEQSVSTRDALREKAVDAATRRVIDDNEAAEREQYDLLQSLISDIRASDDPIKLVKLITPKGRLAKKLTAETYEHRRLLEGGNAFPDVEDVSYDDFSSLWSDIVERLASIGITKISPIGSTGKKSVMGDIDVAIEVPAAFDIADSLKREFGAENVKVFGKTTYSIRWPHNDGFVQVDLMSGKLSYMRWSRFGVGDNEGPKIPVKGVFRNILLNTLARMSSMRELDDGRRERLVIDFDKGLFKKVERRTRGGNWTDDKTSPRELISDDPEEILQILLGVTTHVETFQDLVLAIKKSPKVGHIADDIFDEYLTNVSDVAKSDKRIDATVIPQLRALMLDENNDVHHALSLITERDATGAGGFAYEAVVIRAIKKAGFSGVITKAAGADSSRPDADITVNGKVYPVEVKLDSGAQMGGTSVRWTYGTRKFEFVQELDPAVQNMIKQALTSITGDLKGFVDFIKKQPGNRDVTGFPMSVTKDGWSKAQTKGWLEPLNTHLDHDVGFIVDHYNRKGIHYIQIGGAGLFYMGSNPAGLPVPPLAGDITIMVRAARGGSSLRKSDGREVGAGVIRVQARLKSKGTSPYTLDDPSSIKSMMAALKKSQRTSRTLANIVTRKPRRPSR